MGIDGSIELRSRCFKKIPCILRKERYCNSIPRRSGNSRSFVGSSIDHAIAITEQHLFCTCLINGLPSLVFVLRDFLCVLFCEVPFALMQLPIIRFYYRLFCNSLWLFYNCCRKVLVQEF